VEAQRSACGTGAGVRPSPAPLLSFLFQWASSSAATLFVRAIFVSLSFKALPTSLFLALSLLSALSNCSLYFPRTRALHLPLLTPAASWLGRWLRQRLRREAAEEQECAVRAAHAEAEQRLKVSLRGRLHVAYLDGV
jgi:hypothetical protein